MSTDPLMLPNLPSVDGPELLQLQKRCSAMLSLAADMFPGSQPVSFERKHLETSGTRVSLRTKAFYAAEKTDGVRYMLLILEGQTFAVDRNFKMKRLPPMHFPRRDCQGVLGQTVLDGELIIDDKVGVDGVAVPRFLAYDACCVSGRNLLGEALPVRLMSLRREVLAPRFAAAQEGYDFGGEPFAVEQKDFFALPQLPYIFANVSAGEHGDKWLYAFKDPLRKLVHGNDGIIFTPIVDPYEPGT